ncbi:MAG: nucleoside-triphosphatase [Myxococcaceae bacterium]|nr:nucleoside-triphosphatase [Myxococcaceae bacterium]
MTALPRILLTGVPGVGKTTVVREVVARLPGLDISGFLSEEARGAHGRTGFHVRTWDGRVGKLARTGSTGGPRVGRYAVDLQAFESVALPALALDPAVALYVVDEVGKMECLSTAFEEAMRQLLAAPVPLLATVSLRGGGFMAELRRWPGTKLLEVTRNNRDAMPERVVELLQASLGTARLPDELRP